MLALVHREPGEGIEIDFSPWRLFVIAVAELQRALAALGYPTGEADGTEVSAPMPPSPPSRRARQMAR
jgi:hypothetical protein